MWSCNTIKSLERHAKYEQSIPHHTGEQNSVGEPFYLLLKQSILFINFLKNTSLFVGPLMYIPVVGFYGRLP